MLGYQEGDRQEVALLAKGTRWVWAWGTCQATGLKDKLLELLQSVGKKVGIGQVRDKHWASARGQ